MKTSILAATLFLGFGAVQTVQAAPVNLAPPAGVVTLADAQADRGDLLHTVKGFKKGHHGHRGGRGFGRRGFGHKKFGHSSFSQKRYGFGRFGHHNYPRGNFDSNFP